MSAFLVQVTGRDDIEDEGGVGGMGGSFSVAWQWYVGVRIELGIVDSAGT